MNNHFFSDTANLQPWDAMMKMMVWTQLGDIQNKRILDYGSGTGVTANHFARNNDVVAIEPSSESVANRWRNNEYRQICGKMGALECFEDESFDIIICHNVMEYMEDEEREELIKEFSRLLKEDGLISVVKHNRQGRIMQMVVLLNDFDTAAGLLDGNNGLSSGYGEIRYYDDDDIEKWSRDLKIVTTMGMRTFWDLQQNQDIHRDENWRRRMLEMELKVQDISEFKNIAFFHHLLIKKK